MASTPGYKHADEMIRSDRKGDGSKTWTGFDYYLEAGELGLPNGLLLGDLAFALLLGYLARPSKRSFMMRSWMSASSAFCGSFTNLSTNALIRTRMLPTPKSNRSGEMRLDGVELRLLARAAVPRRCRAREEQTGSAPHLCRLLPSSLLASISNSALGNVWGILLCFVFIYLFSSLVEVVLLLVCLAGLVLQVVDEFQQLCEVQSDKETNKITKTFEGNSTSDSVCPW